MRDRNEALDTRVYARAAASQFGMDRFGESKWRDLEAPLRIVRHSGKDGPARLLPRPRISPDSFRPILPEDPYL